jgi:SAM-dependent methyltransferase
VHNSTLDFARRVVKHEHVAGKKILEVGSYDVNGSIRSLFEELGPKEYIATDARPGPGVDKVADCEHLTSAFKGKTWDVVVCTETLEHVFDWRAAAAELAKSVTPGGFLLLTTLTPQQPTEPGVVLAHDHWIFTVPIVTVILSVCGLGGLGVTVEADPEVEGVFAYAHKPSDWGGVLSLDNVTVRRLKGIQRRCCPETAN